MDCSSADEYHLPSYRVAEDLFLKLVIRSEIEDYRKEHKIAELLTQSPRNKRQWDRASEQIRQNCNLVALKHLDGYERFRLLDSVIASELKNAGVTPTRRTIRWTLAQVFPAEWQKRMVFEQTPGGEPEQPVGGVLVTSFVLVSGDEQYSEIYHNFAFSNTDSDLDLITTAQARVVEHQDWWQKKRGLKLASSDLRALNGRMRERSEIDKRVENFVDKYPNADRADQAQKQDRKKLAEWYRADLGNKPSTTEATKSVNSLIYEERVRRKKISIG